MTTDELIETLERLEKEATPGPWTVDRTATRRKETCAILSGNNRRIADTLNADEVEIYEEDGDWFDVQGDRNFKLIAALRNHLPALISALKENKRMREALTVFSDHTVSQWAHPSESATTIILNAGVIARAALQPQGEK